jgi:hypothetical protein
MVVAEIIKTCTHAKVAQAAVASIGGDFSSRVNVVAVRRGVDAGAFAAEAVKDFDRRAGVGQRRAIEAAVERTDMPVLHGLRIILEDALQRSAQ